ncbi:MAG: hypothetical protein A3F84_19210 [Candidatus Handelsmanbacteria bacterium RIFCSPLOWO2_12_FULL_64_10]|uniref:DUF362 domain-containing protein n=1 Tax=Handelsmanbacteria sp. (strain RIFCSPLOWO2_12_FULL_64_10) TaxID=1817868 RepID=A0A1F6D6Y6_HANXR|nr:MAG: hypothetical protein A3F84_19210 [Candidatus Handelsmanbacteria bacterium RIFCSPLOWO2_12_FULL_64_10]
MGDKAYAVRAARCDHRASEEEIYRTLRRITDPLTRSWEKIEKAKRVVIKFNMMKMLNRLHFFEGRRRELVDDAVCRSVLRLLKEHTTAELIATDTNPYTPEHLMGQDFNYAHHLKAFGVRFVDSNLPPFKTYKVPGGGLMFDQYTLSACFADADAVVSVAKMKNHLFMGVTLCMKNLFGLPPITLPAGRARTYFHHFIRLSCVLPDLALITQPCLNIIDALTGQWGREWDGEGRVCDALIAGDQVTATDACGAYLMGHDPASDWPTPPFRRDRNHLLMAARRGFGTVDLKEIDFESDVKAPLAAFDSEETDPPETVSSWRRTTCEQGLFYRDRKRDIVDRFRGEFIFLQDGEVVWHGPDPSNLGSRRRLSGEKKDRAMWLKLADPEEREGERFGVYEECLAGMAA